MMMMMTGVVWLGCLALFLSFADGAPLSEEA